MRQALAFALVCGGVVAALTSESTTLALYTINAPEQLEAVTRLPDRPDWGRIYSAWRASFDVRSCDGDACLRARRLSGSPRGLLW